MSKLTKLSKYSVSIMNNHKQADICKFIKTKKVLDLLLTKKSIENQELFC